MKKSIVDHFSGHWQDFYLKYLPSLKPIGGDEYQALCPLHDDKNPSLNINAQTGQFFCHGCGKKGDAFHFYGKVSGLRTKADFAKILKGIGQDFGISGSGKQKRIVEKYDYLDLNGNLHSQTLRYNPKGFKQRRPDGKGGWIWEDVFKYVKPIIYNLPEVVKSDFVCIVEGEKDVETLRGLGVVATTGPMGAKKWRSEYSEHFKGKHIILLPDNDQEGKEHMMQVGQALNGHAASLRLVELPGLPSKGDVTDFVAKAGDKARDELWGLIDMAPEYKPPEKMTQDKLVLTAHDFMKIELPDRRIFLHPWLQEQSIALLAGWRGVGKSWFALDLLRCVSKGEPFGPWEPGEKVPTLYVDGEMTPQDVQERLFMLDPGLKHTVPLHIYCDCLANAYGLPRANLLSEKWRSTMQRILTTRKIKVWVLDNLVSLCPGIDENSQREWSPVNEWLLNLRFQGISTIMLHHTGKGGSQRGTSGREDNIDTSIILRRPHDYNREDGARFICHFGKARVRLKDLPLTTDLEFNLIEDDQNRSVWMYGSTKGKNRVEVLKALDEGMTQKDVADLLGITKGTVSKIRAQAIKDGWMTEKNKFTQTGFENVCVS